MQDEILRLEGIGLSLGGRKLFRDVSISVRRGEMWGLTGGSGCGKTSLLRLILGFLLKDDGVVTVEGTAFTADTAYPLRRGMTYVPQELSFPYETVKEVVRVPFDLKANRDVEFSEPALFRHWQEVGLDQSLYEMDLSKISGGQKQRIMLVSAVLLGKPLLLLDEPTSAIDADNVELVKRYLRSLCNEGRAILVVTHDARLLEACDRLLNLTDEKYYGDH